MAGRPEGFSSQRKQTVHLYLLIFGIGMVFTFALWDTYLNGTIPLDHDVGSVVVLIAGTAISVIASLFSWSLESRKSFLEKEVDKRTRELHQKNEDLKDRNKEIENFIHIISHDLKAPIVSIRGFASILETELGSALEGAKAEYFHRIVANAKQMNELIVDLLEFSRVGRVEDEKEPVELKALFQELIEELKPELDRKKIQVRLSPDLPVVWGTKKRLAQVFLNLVGNAAKYMGAPAQPVIEVGCDPQNGKFVSIWVKDNGIGIKKEFQEKIFQIFQRAPNSLNVEGTGIGLSIVKKIVELNGGRVGLESEEGKGSRFIVDWPVQECAVPFPKVPGLLSQSTEIKPGTFGNGTANVT